MKKLLSISLIVVISFIAFSFTTAKTSNAVEPVKPKKVEVTVEDDALYCSVTIDGATHTCWFCDCVEFVKALKNIN